MTDAIRAAKVRRKVHDSWAEWLDEIPWDHYVTLTFRRNSGPDRARRTFTAWIRCLEQEAEMPLFWFVGFEDGPLNGRLHMHCLVGNTRDLPANYIAKKWKHGFSRIDLYEKDRGATHYITKYVVKEMFDYDVSPNLARALAARDRQPSLPGLIVQPTKRGKHV